MATADQSLSASFSELLATARGHFVWPNDVILYCLPARRELLTDKIRRLCFQTYLQLCELAFETKTAPNADAMSPNGAAPILTVRIGPHLTIFSDFNKLTQFLDAQSLGLECGREPVLRADNEAFISLVTTRMAPAEVHQTWICTKNFNQHSVRARGSAMAWPLSKLVPWLHLAELVWNDWSLITGSKEEALDDFRSACDALDKRLGKSGTFFNGGPSSLDVMVFSHVRAILTTPLPSNELCDIVNEHPNLSRFCETLSARHNLQS